MELKNCLRYITQLSFLLPKKKKKKISQVVALMTVMAIPVAELGGLLEPRAPRLASFT